MNLRLPMHLAEGYKSPSQRARRFSEGWGGSNLYCCACISEHLDPEATNTHVTDFRCPDCIERYQLKSQKNRLGRSITGAGYQRLMDAVLTNQSPNFFLLHYHLTEEVVRNLLIIPRFAISPSVIIQRNPLSAAARRSNWTGYVLNVGLIPESAKIPLIIDGSEVPHADVREQYARIAKIRELKPEQRGWTLDVLRCVESLPNETFSNDEIYAFESDLAKLYPGNHHIKDKIRQQLQVLRDRGLLKQVERGVWQRT
jgi:type II restriction enzyme